MSTIQKIEGPVQVGDTSTILETIMEDVTPSTASLPGEEEGRALDCTKNGLPDISIADLPSLGVTVKDLALSGSLPGSLLVATSTATVLPDTQVYGSTEVAIGRTPPATPLSPIVDHGSAGVEPLTSTGPGSHSSGNETSDGTSTPNLHNPPARDGETRDGKIRVIDFTATTPGGGDKVERAPSPTASPQSLRSVNSESNISASEYPHIRENAFAEFESNAERSNGVYSLDPHGFPGQDDEIRVIGTVEPAPGENRERRPQPLPKFERGVGPAPGERGWVGRDSPKKPGFLKKFFSKKQPAIGHHSPLAITPKTKAKEQVDATKGEGVMCGHSKGEGIVTKIIDIKKKLTGKSTNMATGSKM